MDCLCRAKGNVQHKMKMTLLTALVLAYCSVFIVVVKATCSTTAIGTVVLNECPLHEYSFTPGETLTMEYVPYTWNLPNGLSVQTRVFKLNNLEPRIPCGVLKMNKGMNASVLLNNSVAGGSSVNLHTHGLHIHGGIHPDGVYSDDVSAQVSTSAKYRFEIPGDHAGGYVSYHI